MLAFSPGISAKEGSFWDFWTASMGDNSFQKNLFFLFFFFAPKGDSSFFFGSQKRQFFPGSVNP